MDKKFTVSFNGCFNHNEIIKRLNFVFELTDKDNVDITLDFYAFRDFIYPDYAVLIIAMIDYARANVKSIRGRLINLKKKNNGYEYLVKMNFFHLLGADFIAQKHDENNSDFLEISKYERNNHSELIDGIIFVLKNNILHINENVLVSLDYCLGEILDNIINYSGNNEGWVATQYFPSTNKIRLVICDTGYGIPFTLNFTKEESLRLSQSQSLLTCIEKDVTSGFGQGHGLYATSAFVEENKGILKIFSDNSMLDFKSSNDKKVLPSPLWRGTIVFMELNTNINVDYKKFTSEFFDQKEHFNERQGLW